MKKRSLLTISILSVLVIFMNLFVSWKNIPVGISDSDIRQSVNKSFLILEKSGYLFTERSRAKCAGCHHTTLTSMVAALAREKGIPVIDSFSDKRVEAMIRNLKSASNPNLIRQIPDNQFQCALYVARPVCGKLSSGYHYRYLRRLYDKSGKTRWKFSGRIGEGAFAIRRCTLYCFHHTLHTALCFSS